MNVFTGWLGWLILAAWLLLGAAVAAAWHLTKRAYMRHHIRAAATRRRVNDTLTRHEQRMYEHLTAAGERIHPRDGMPRITMRIGDAWPDDLCAYPPCSLEDSWVCDQHQPEPGKHRLGSSQSRGHDVIQAVVTDLPDPWDSRWAR